VDVTARTSSWPRDALSPLVCFLLNSLFVILWKLDPTCVIHLKGGTSVQPGPSSCGTHSKLFCRKNVMIFILSWVRICTNARIPSLEHCKWLDVASTGSAIVTCVINFTNRSKGNKKELEPCEFRLSCWSISFVAALDWYDFDPTKSGWDQFHHR